MGHSSVNNSKERGRSQATTGANRFTKDVAYSTNATFYTEQENRMSHNTRGRSLTRQSSIKGNSKLPQEYKTKNHLLAQANAKLEEIQPKATYSQSSPVKRKFSKHSAKKPATTHFDRNTNPTSRSPHQESQQAQRQNTHNEMWNKPHTPSNTSNHVSSVSSREQTPMAKPVLNVSQDDVIQENVHTMNSNRNKTEPNSSSTTSRIKSGKGLLF